MEIISLSLLAFGLPKLITQSPSILLYGQEWQFLYLRYKVGPHKLVVLK